ncbi:hypothetical protein ACILD7_05710 [Capnocytophaga canimorsus]|uniref:Transglutaminase-like domain-containing protein n=1 Tax=Capnocytophaga canimorsus (strain 5) TaxID=860228 RepID=F9YTE7_CAPCC|nr:hypothetical protein [Capnocytophaga canimorsus]AEK22809.1 Conserved hypothetical protein [Capnocytophaga canimorsus Cc5]WGU71379.1 hypothetical protein QIU18_06040 [Capnocytophaga canimorsus]
MKYVRRFLGIIAVIVLMGWLFRGDIYRNLITYQSVGNRGNFALNNNELKVKLEGVSIENLDIENVINIAQKITSETLTFSFEKCGDNPNLLLETQKANCMGYAQFFALVCNYMLKKNNLHKEWVAKVYIGKLKFLGNDIHQYFQSSFFKDHDFVVVENVRTQEIYAVDPTLYDYFVIKKVRFVR